MNTIPGNPNERQRSAAVADEILRELQALRREQSALRRLFDEFAGAFLNAKFPFGQSIDRWRRR
jgi:hypothetical protein